MLGQGRAPLVVLGVTVMSVIGARLMGASPSLLIAAGVIGALLGLAIVFVRRKLREGLTRNLPADHPEVVALCSRLPLREPWPRFGGWAILPDFAELLLELTKERPHACILELGGGASTQVLAAALGDSTRIVSVEAEKRFADDLRDALTHQELTDHVEVLDAAMSGTPPWYDRERVQSAAERLGPIDLLVVDGPSTALDARAREPAMPELLSRLAPDATVVLDDTVREGEQAIVEAWREQGLLEGFEVEQRPLGRGAIVLRRQST
ncbi:MAG: class I SAM-dependent methyltransferase [Acidobacteriota bacterium]